MKRTSLWLCLLTGILSSCVTVNRTRYTAFTEKGLKPGFATDSAYEFRNEPRMVHNWVNFTDTVPLENEYYTLWYQLDFKSKLKMEELRHTYVRVTPLSRTELKFDLVNRNDVLIKSIRRKITRYKNFIEIKPRTYFESKFLLVNGITSVATAIALTQTGDLLVLDEIGGMVFLVVMPFGGSSNGDSYEYGRYVSEQ